MRRLAVLFTLLAAFALSPAARSACCFFVPVGKNVTQPSQRAFITWDGYKGVESFTVQPVFEGDANDFGMVVPTPSRPKLTPMPRDFFAALDAFTTLAPTPRDKFKLPDLGGGALGGFGGGGFGMAGGGGGKGGAVALPAPPPVRVLEAGMVGTLDYKIVVADESEALYQWLKDNHFKFEGSEKILDFYIKKGWGFTVMRIDPKEMRKGPSGRLVGELTPTRFTFSTRYPVYPLHITKVSAPNGTDALLYLHSREKLDLAGSASYQFSWTKRLRSAFHIAYPEKLSPNEKNWMQLEEEARPQLDQLAKTCAAGYPGWTPAQFEWARELTSNDTVFPQVRAARVRNDRTLMSKLRGHLKEQWLVRVRKRFCPKEMESDLTFQTARLAGRADISNHPYLLPNSSF